MASNAIMAKYPLSYCKSESDIKIPSYSVQFTIQELVKLFTTV